MAVGMCGIAGYPWAAMLCIPTATQGWEDDGAGSSPGVGSGASGTLQRCLSLAWMGTMFSRCETIFGGFSLAIVQLRK